MNHDELKKAWRKQTPRTSLTIDPDVLLKEIQRNQKAFTAMRFWRDVREAGLALLMVPFWFYLGAAYSLPWTWYLVVPGLVWVAGFLLVDRMLHSRRPPGEPLTQCAGSSLTQVEHQIWLLRHVLWWYLSPIALPMMLFFGHVGWLARDVGWLIIPVMALLVAVASGILAAVYWLNQRAVRRELEPRRQELVTLIQSLKEPGAG